MNRLLITIILVVLQTTGYAINFSGHITGNTTWTKANSPYIINGHCLVDSNATLTIEPGAEIVFHGAYHFYVEGNISAIGTATESIILRGGKTWIGFECRQTSSPKTLTFKYCKLSDAVTAIQMADNTELTLTDCIVLNNSQYGLRTKNKFHISNSKFTGMPTAILCSPMPCQGEISYSEFYNCSTGIVVQHTAIVKNNYFHHNKSEGIFVLLAKAAIVTDNIFANNNYGIIINKSKFSKPVKGNMFAYNNYGFSLHNFSDSFSQNTAKHNQWVGELYDMDAKGVIDYNCFDSNAKNIKLKGSNHAYAKYNYWGTADSAFVNGKMEDWDNDFVSGQVNCMPLLAQADPICQSINIDTAKEGPTSIIKAFHQYNVVVYPNPAIDQINFKSEIEINNVTISGIDGRTTTSLSFNSKTANVDISQYPAGMYLYSVTLQDGTLYTGKLLKQ